MIRKMVLASREEWLAARRSYIGGSDAGAVLGLNPFKTNVELWEEKTGWRQADNVSDFAAVRYGASAEMPLRMLFALDYPEYTVEYESNTIWLNDEYPFAHASVDGLLHDADGRLGILEIKTATIKTGAQGEKWRDKIPDHYYAQVLHYMMVLEADFAILKAQLKYEGEARTAVTKHYRIDRNEGEIDFLIELERGFAGYIERNEKPPLILPPV